jgi:S1-C subfamily serine protease
VSAGEQHAAQDLSYGRGATQLRLKGLRLSTDTNPVTFDETWDEGSRRRAVLPVAVAALVIVCLAGVLLSAFTLTSQRGALARERAAWQGEVSKLRSDLNALSGRDQKLAGRLNTAERKINRREVGIAPLAARVLRSVFTVETDYGLGTGFVAWQDESGTYLVTAHHVVEGNPSSSVTIVRKGGSWAGTIEAIDPKNDLAVIRINGKPAGAKPLWQSVGGRGRPKPGDELILVGSPFGLQGTVTTGVVSRVSRTRIQTDAAANPGNSGGPAIDKQGRIVGVLVSGVNPAFGQNLNFAVPIDRVCVKLRRC